MPWGRDGREPRRRRTLALGLVVAAGYTTVYLGTLALSDDHQRPLFDGFAPSAPYRWVDPPSEFEAGNVRPQPSTIELPLGPEGLEVASANSDDGQLVLNLPQGAVPPREGDTMLRVVVTPLAPATLGPPPGGLFADGNAYRVQLSYQPSGQVVDALAEPGNVVLTVPAPAVALLDSPDGRTWQRVEGSSHSSGSGLASPMTRVGYFMGAADAPVRGADDGGSGGSGVWLVAALTVALAAGLVLVPVLVRRSRRRRTTARRKPGGRPHPQRRQPARKKKKKKHKGRKR